MRINCCSYFVSIGDPGSDRTIRSPQPALLLRLLLLSREDHVSHGLISRVLNIQLSGVRKYCQNLNEQLEKGAVESVRGHLRLNWSREDTDFAEFLRLVEQARCIAVDLKELVLGSPELAEAEALLDQACAIWQASPATGLDSYRERKQTGRGKAKGSLVPTDQEQITLEHIVFEWDDRWTDALLLLADLLLIEGQGPAKAKKAFISLTDLVKEPECRDDVWRRRLSAAAKMENPDRHRTTWKQCLSAYEKTNRKLPAEFQPFAPERPTRLVEVSLPTTVTEAADIVADIGEEVDPRLALMDTLGITSASALKLQGSRLEPADCIQRAKHTLWFAGVLAGKWVKPPDVRRDLEALLERFDAHDRAPGSEVRFLILDPEAEGYAQLQQMRGDALNPESINQLAELSARYQCLEVRGIAILPAFRVIVIDDDLVSFSPYALEQEARMPSKTGWDAPHVMLDPLASWPLAAGVRLYFEQTWDKARPLGEETL